MSSTVNSYHVDNTTMYFSFCLNSLLPLVARQFKRHILYAEGFMLKLLEENNSTINAEDIRDLLAHLHTPIIYAYILVGGILLSLLAIPLICCFGFCTKKNIDSTKYQCCFPIEILCHVLFMMCLLIGIIGLYQVTIQIQDALILFPILSRNVIEDLRINADIFKNQVKHVVNTIEMSTNSINVETTKIPEKIINLYSKQLNKNLQHAILKFNRLEFDKELSIYYDRGFIFNYSASNMLNKLHAKQVYEQIKNVVYNNILNGSRENFPVNAVGKDLEINKDFKSVNYKFSKWKIISDDLQIAFNDLLPGILNSLLFMDHFGCKIKNYINTNSELNRIKQGTKNLQEISSAIENKINKIIKELFPIEIQNFVINQTENIDRYLSRLAITRNPKESKFTNGNLWLMLIPTVYAIIVFTLLTATFVGATTEVKKIVVHRIWNQPTTHTLWILKMFRISMSVSVAFLWLLLILSVFFYLAYLPLSVFCEAVNDQKIFTKFIDKPSVWRNNKTLLDYKLGHYLPAHNGHQLKMSEVLNKCRQNKTIFASINLHQYWNVTQHIEALNIKVNIGILQTIVAKALKEIKTPDCSMRNFINKLEVIQENLDRQCLSLITMKSNRLLRNNMRNKTMTTITDVVSLNLDNEKDILEKFGQPTMDVNVHVLEHVAQLIKLKYSLKNMSQKIGIVAKTLSNFSLIIEETNSQVLLLLNSTSRNITRTIIHANTLIQQGIRRDVGNCFVLPFVYDKAKRSVCNYGLSLITAAWICLGLISISIGICIIFSCRISGYIRGANSHNCPWRQHVESQRYSSQTAKLNGTLQHDRLGNYSGSTVRIKENTVEQGVATT